MNSTAIITNAPTALSRRRAMQSIAAVSVAGLVSSSLASERMEGTADLDRLIAAYEEKEQAHVDLLDLEEMIAGKYVVADEDRADLNDAIFNAIDAADNALVDVLGYVPTNTAEAFAKARWMLEYKESVQGDWRDFEVEAIITSTTFGWMER